MECDKRNVNLTSVDNLMIKDIYTTAKRKERKGKQGKPTLLCSKNKGDKLLKD